MMRVYSVYITPTLFFVKPAFPEQSNQGIRKCKESAAHFLRVSITTDLLQKQYFHMFQCEDLNQILFEDQLEKIFKNGFSLAGLHFSFVAASGSAYKNLSGWYVNDQKNKKELIKSFGQFRPEIMSKRLARIGQVYSTSRRILDIPLDQIVREEEITNGTEYNFTDGCGYISTSLMKHVLDEYDLVKCSAVQIRLGGAIKGVLQENPDLGQDDLIAYRDGMKKFEPSGNMLDLGIIRCSTFS